MSKKLPKNARILITLDNGAVVRMRAVSPMLISKIDEAVAARWEAEGRALAEKPTYTVTTAAGVEEIHEHDAVSIAEVEDPEIRAGLQAQLGKAEDDAKAFGLDAPVPADRHRCAREPRSGRWSVDREVDEATHP